MALFDGSLCCSGSFDASGCFSVFLDDFTESNGGKTGIGRPAALAVSMASACCRRMVFLYCPRFFLTGFSFGASDEADLDSF